MEEKSLSDTSAKREDPTAGAALGPSLSHVRRRQQFRVQQRLEQIAKEKLDDALVSLFLPLLYYIRRGHQERVKLPFSRHMDEACFGFVSAGGPSTDGVRKCLMIFGLPSHF